MKRALPIVQKLIAAPCDVPWSSMKGDDKTRHCGECDRSVHNLSAMSKDELQAFLHAIVNAPANANLPCISMFARPDGTVLLEDCPVGLRARRRRALIASTLGLGGLALAAVTALVFLHRTTPITAAREPVPVSVTTVQTAEASKPEPVPSVIAPAILSDAPGFVTVEGPPGTAVFEGATRVGTISTVPLTIQAPPGDHTYRASFKGKDEVFALTVGPNSCGMHRLALGTAKPVTTSPTTTPGWKGHHLAGKIAAPRDRTL